MMDNDRLRRAGLAIWATIGLVGLTVAGATFITALRIEWRSFLALVSCGVLMAAAAWFYRSVRNERRLALRLVLLLAYSSFAVQTVTTVFALGVPDGLPASRPLSLPSSAPR